MERKTNPQGHRPMGHSRPRPHHRAPFGTPRIPYQKKDVVIPTLAPGDIRIIPIIGVEEIGCNMTLIEMNDQIIIIDAGVKIANASTPGVNYLIPNTKYLEENKHKIKAMVITHGHLDHIGAIPYIINRIGNPPIFTREFGALLIKAKASEFPEINLDVHIIDRDDGSITLSNDFKVRFFGLTHSIPDSTGVIIETPLGDIVSTGDVRVENNDGIPTEKEIEQYALFKKRKILLMTMDSTGIPSPGWSGSERAVVDTIDGIIKNVTGRLIIATFASQVERVMEFLKSAKKYGKYVVVEGRSMKTNIGIVRQLDLTDLSHIIPIEDIDKHPPHKIMVITTGGQGEDYAGLVRMADRTHKFIRLNSTDTVILSSSVIPGNEARIDQLKDNLYRGDSKILTYIDNMVHTSGHGKRDELAWIHKQIDYKFFMPIHGNHHRLKMHAELAVSLGAKPENIVVADNGSPVDIIDGGNKIIMHKEKVPAEPMTVEGSRVGEMENVVLRDRKILMTEGIFVVIVALDTKTKKMFKSPDIISRGFVYLRDNQELIQETRALVRRIIMKGLAEDTDPELLKKRLADDLARHLFQRTAKRPIVIPVILGL